MSASETGTLQVYLIDDDPDHVLIISRAIREAAPGTTVQPIADGAKALTALRQQAAPDLILLDINMPGLSGFDILTELKADPQLKHIPVVMLTSSELSSDVARAYELGASGYISKPSYLHDVRAVLGNTLLYWSVMKRAAGQGVTA
jgi:two-component system, chemotaxis family, response regulator Rcp1